MNWLTGDTHRDFARVFDFCRENETTVDDILIILGDAGINYFLDDSDRELKEELSTLDLTLFCVHGNHEERPSSSTATRKRTGAAALSIARRSSPISSLPRTEKSTTSTVSKPWSSARTRWTNM